VYIMLGWKVLEKGEYKTELPRLSDQEEKLILDVEELFKKEMRSKTIKSKEECKELIEKIIYDYAKQNRMHLDLDQLDYLSEVAAIDVYGNRFLDYLIKDPEIEEISVIGVNKPVYVYIRNKGWKTTNLCFTNDEIIKETINKIGKELGRRITLQKPMLNATLDDGSRLHATLSPVSEGEITIRKFREKPISPKQLYLNKTIDKRILALLSLIVQGDNNIIIAGNTASGKTTMLNALFSFVPMNERVVITEETPEINIPHKHQLRLVTQEEMEIDITNLIYNSLRMRPDRTIVGEVRNRKEVHALFDVLTSGQARGSFATFHAQNAEEACTRIKNFGIDSLSSIDFILVLRRMLNYRNNKNSEIRKVIELYSPKIGYIYNYQNGKLKLSIKDNLIKMIGEKLGLSKSETKKELERRERLIERADEEFSKFYNRIQKELYGL